MFCVFFFFPFSSISGFILASWWLLPSSYTFFVAVFLLSFSRILILSLRQFLYWKCNIEVKINCIHVFCTMRLWFMILILNSDFRFTFTYAWKQLKCLNGILISPFTRNATSFWTQRKKVEEADDWPDITLKFIYDLIEPRFVFNWSVMNALCCMLPSPYQIISMRSMRNSLKEKDRWVRWISI